MPITRTSITDDDGTGTTGTVLNNAWKQELYNQIDAFVPAAVTFATYTPSWLCTPANPVVGNGSLLGWYAQIAGPSTTMKIAVIELVWGSTTTGGNGNWLFSLPLPFSRSTTSLPFVFTGAQHGGAYTFAGGYPVSSNQFNPFGQPVGGTTAAVSLTAVYPFTWGSGDKITIYVLYI